MCLARPRLTQMSYDSSIFNFARVGVGDRDSCTQREPFYDFAKAMRALEPGSPFPS